MSDSVLTGSLPRAFTRLAYSSGGHVSGPDGTPSSWRGLADRVRLLALGLADSGFGAGTVVAVRLDPGPDLLASVLAAQAAGAVVEVADGASPDGAAQPAITAREEPGDDLAPEALDIVELAARGAKLDARQPDAFEQMVAGLSSAEPALRLAPVGSAASFSHDAVLWAARSITRALAPGAGKAAADAVVVAAPPTDPLLWLFGLWWPLVNGASVRLAGPSDAARAVAERHPTIVAGSPAAFDALAEAARLSRPGRGAPGSRALLRLNRLEAAGEHLGRVQRAELGVLRRRLVPAIRGALGLDALRFALSSDVLEEGTRRDLTVAAVSVARGWTPPGCFGPATLAEPGEPDSRVAGLPLPGRAVRVAADGAVEVLPVDGCGAGAAGPGCSPLATGCHGWLDRARVLHLRPCGIPSR